MKRSVLKVGIVIMLASAIAAFFVFDLGQYATLDTVKAQQVSLHEYYQHNRWLVLGGFGAAYVTVTALSLPAATILTLLGGGLFGFIPGLLMVSFSSSIGATLAFLMARFLLKESVQEKYGTHLANINEGFAREGAFYLFALRLVPVVPFFVVNILMSLMPIKTRIFYLVSQLGMLPATAVYVYAGTELADLESLSDIVSPSMLVAFVLLGLLPLLAKKAVNMLRHATNVSSPLGGEHARRGSVRAEAER